MNEAEQFFYDHAGSSYVPAKETLEEGKVRGAKELAAAEQKLKEGPYFVSWETDDRPWDGDVPYDGPLWVAILWSVDGTSTSAPLASLGSIACEEGDPYQRVIEAELMVEHLAIEAKHLDG